MGDSLIDYKLYFSYDRFITTQVISDRHNGFYINYYDENWSLLDIERADRQNNKNPLDKPQSYDVMIEKGSILAKEFPFSRIDFYYVNGKVYLGEISFFPNNGFVKFKDQKMDRYISDKIILPITKQK